MASRILSQSLLCVAIRAISYMDFSYGPDHTHEKRVVTKTLTSSPACEFELNFRRKLITAYWPSFKPAVPATPCASVMFVPAPMRVHDHAEPIVYVPPAAP